MRNGLKLLLWIAIVTGVATGIYLLSGKETKSKPQYTYGKVVRGDIRADVLATGTLSPLITVQVGSQVSGTIQYLKADFNMQVKKGDVIAQIEPSLFRAQVAQSKAKLRSAEAANEKALVTLRDAKRQLERKIQLRNQKMLSESELDIAVLNHEKAEVEYKVQLANIDEAKAALQQAEVNLAHTTIYAPIDGIVLSRDVDVGQTVAASLQAPTLFTIAQDLTHMQIETEVDESNIGRIKVGLPVSFTVYAYPDRIFTGTLAQIRLNPNLEQDVVRYNCIIHVDNKDLSLKPGMTATVNIQAAQKNDVLKVPNSALRYIPDIPSSALNKIRNELKLTSLDGVIWTFNEKGPEPIKVNLGLSSETETEIEGKRVHEGLEIILTEKKSRGPQKRNVGLQLF